METITIEEAITRGRRRIYYPALVILISTLGLGFYLAGCRILSVWAIPASFIPAILLSWLYWSLTIVKWKIWAFENVRNVHELKKRAIRENLISSDDSFFTKTEIKSAAEKEKWKALQLKFKKADVLRMITAFQMKPLFMIQKGFCYLNFCFIRFVQSWVFIT